VGVGLEIAEDLEPIAAFPVTIPDLTRVHSASGANQHRSNLEPVPHAIGIGDYDGSDGGVVEVDAEAVGQLLVETAVATFTNLGHRDRIEGSQISPAQATSAGRWMQASAGPAGFG
jgi:hypothetical protein